MVPSKVRCSCLLPRACKIWPFTAPQGGQRTRGGQIEEATGFKGKPHRGKSHCWKRALCLRVGLPQGKDGDAEWLRDSLKYLKLSPLNMEHP